MKAATAKPLCDNAKNVFSTVDGYSPTLDEAAHRKEGFGQLVSVLAQ